MLLNTIVEPEGAEAGGHRHALFCLPVFAREFDTTIVVPQFVRDHVRALYLYELPQVAIANTPAGNVVRGNRGFALILRSICGVFIRHADVFYASSSFVPDVIGPSLWRLLRPRTKLIVVIHHLADMHQREAVGQGNPLVAAFEAISLVLVRRFATTVIAGNDIVRTQLIERGIAPERLAVTTNGVRHRVPASALEGREREMVFVGRVSLRKGIGDLCRAWKQAAGNTGWRLTLVGALEPRDAGVIEPLLDETPGVRYAGRVSEEELAGILARAAVFVMPSYEEGWCIAIAEAMACGLPVISYALPVFERTFDRGRIAVPIGDVERLGSALRHLIDDADERARLAREAWEKGLLFDWNRAGQMELAAFL